MSLYLGCPFGVVDVVCWNGCAVVFRGAGFGESNRSVVGGLCVPIECGAVEAVFDLVQWVVVDVEAVEFGCGGRGFVCVWCGLVASMSACGLMMCC